MTVSRVATRWASAPAFASKNTSHRSSYASQSPELGSYGTDFQEESVPCSYLVGDRVLLLRPERRQKCVPPFESGWHVSEVVSPSTVRIRRASQEKTVNVAFIKPDLSDDTTERVPAGEDRGVPAILGVEREVCGPPPLYFTLNSRAEDTGCNLRDRSSLRPPERYQE